MSLQPAKKKASNVGALTTWTPFKVGAIIDNVFTFMAETPLRGHLRTPSGSALALGGPVRLGIRQILPKNVLYGDCACVLDPLPAKDGDGALLGATSQSVPCSPSGPRPSTQSLHRAFARHPLERHYADVLQRTLRPGNRFSRPTFLPVASVLMT